MCKATGIDTQMFAEHGLVSFSMPGSGLGVHFGVVVPGVVLESSGADGLRWPFAFSGVVELTPVLPGPAVEGSVA